MQRINEDLSLISDEGRCFIDLNNGEIRSGYIGPFGGLYFANLNQYYFENISQEYLSQLIKFAEDKRLKSISFRLPTITQFPEIYLLNKNLLLKNNFRLKWIDYNSEVTTHSILNRNRRRELKSIKSDEILFIEVDAKVSFNILYENRLSKNRMFRLDLETFLRLADLKDRVWNFGLIKNDIVIACVMALKISEEILHVYAWGENVNYPDSANYISTLYVKLKQWWFENKGTRICLGVSSENGIVNNGLLDYKKSLGAQVSERITLNLDIV